MRVFIIAPTRRCLKILQNRCYTLHCKLGWCRNLEQQRAIMFLAFTTQNQILALLSTTQHWLGVEKVKQMTKCCFQVLQSVTFQHNLFCKNIFTTCNLVGSQMPLNLFNTKNSTDAITLPGSTFCIWGMALRNNSHNSTTNSALKTLRQNDIICSISKPTIA